MDDSTDAANRPSGCLYCGSPAPADPGVRVMTGWSTQRDPRGRSAAAQLLCPSCTRTHTRDIEAKLDEQFWA